jgi:hypothetical protein
MNYRTAAAAVLLAVGVFGVPLPNMSGVSLVSISEPSAEMKSVVQPVVKVVSRMSAVDRLWLQQIYSNFSKVVAADGLVDEPVVTTTDGLRAIHVAVLSFIWRGMAENSPGKYKGLAEAVDEAMKTVISEDSRQLTPEDRKAAVDLCEAIAWAGLGKDQ